MGAFEPVRVAVVVAGAGARGGYEAGVLSVLLVKLAEAGIVPNVFVGTSAGAINAALFASVAHLPAAEQGEAVLDVWRTIHRSDVFRSPILTSLGTTGRWAGQLLGVPGVRLTGLLDTSPLQAMAERAVDWERLHSNVDADLTSLAVVTTSAAANRTVVFVDRGGLDPLPPSDDDRPIDYAAARIGPAHVLASAAIPVVFPPVLLTAGSTPGESTPGGWYVDGGVRLNAPLKPALALGADGVIIVATHPAVDGAVDCGSTDAGEPPDIDDMVVRMMDAALVDRMVEDLRTLAKINVLVSEREAGGAGQPGAREHVVVPYLALGPAERGSVGRLAAEVFGRRSKGWSGVVNACRDPDLRLLGRLLGGDGTRRGDLLSYLYFDPDFLEASIELGRKDAEAAFGGVPSSAFPWKVGP